MVQRVYLFMNTTSTRASISSYLVISYTMLYVTMFLFYLFVVAFFWMVSIYDRLNSICVYFYYDRNGWVTAVSVPIHLSRLVISFGSFLLDNYKRVFLSFSFTKYFTMMWRSGHPQKKKYVPASTCGPVIAVLVLLSLIIDELYGHPYHPIVNRSIGWWELQ
jgi:hypothetical protein